MEDKRITTLTYGNLGAARYDEELKRWIFGRRPGRRNILYPVTESTPVIQKPSISPVPSSDDITKREADNASRAKAKKGFERDFAGLSSFNSHLAAALPFVKELHHTSKALESLDCSVDPCVSKLFAFGRARPAIQHRDQDVSHAVAAMATGADHMSVRIVQLVESSATWPGDADGATQVATVTFAEDTLGWWTSDSGQIRQVAFGFKALESPIWLAVRTTGGTSILEPTIQYKPLRAFNPLKGRSELCRIGSNPRLFVSCEETGDAPHADVAFSSFNNQYFAIVDERGKWSVLKIISPMYKKRIRWETRLSGDLFKRAEREETDEGWARICWVSDSKTIAVCSRRMVRIYTLDAKPVVLDSPEIGLRNTADWILAMQACRLQLDVLVFLTSSALVMLRVTSRPGPDEETHDATSRVILSWRHFRDKDDISLQIELHEEEERITIFLFSRANALVTVYQIAVSDDDELSSASDPYHLEAPGPISPRKPALMDLSISPCQYVTNFVGRQEQSTGQTYENAGIRFTDVYALFSDLSCSSRLYAQGPFTKEDGTTTKALAPSAFARRDMPDLDRSRSVSKLDRGFVVEDSDLGSSETSKEDELNRLVLLPKTPPRTSRRVVADRSPQLEQLNQFVSDAILRFHEARGEGHSVTEYIDVVGRQFQEKLALNNQPTETVYQLLQPRSFNDDFTEVSQELKDFFDTLSEAPAMDSEARVYVHPLANPALHGFPFSRHSASSQDSQTQTLSTVYENLVACWITPLPDSVSVRVRIAKERLARQVAVELYLSSFGVSLRSSSVVPQEELENDMFGDSQSQYSNPSRASKSQTQHSSPMLDVDQLSQRSTVSVFGDGEGDGDSAMDGNSILSRLSKYASFEAKENDALMSMSEAVKRVVTQWRVGTEPETFSWTAFRSAQSQSKSLSASASSGRPKRKRSASSGSRSQERPRPREIQRGINPIQNSIRETMTRPPRVRQTIERGFWTQGPHSDGLLDQQPPNNSQPGLNSRGFAFAKSSQVPSTQEVAGPWGARQGIKKPVKKKRKMGF